MAEEEHDDRQENLKCPFCEECDFDLIGLKCHLLNYCGVFKDTKSIS